METTSLGLRQDGTRDLETERDRTSSRAWAPDTERASARADCSAIGSVAPTAKAWCGSTGKPDAALGERAAGNAYQVAGRHCAGGASQTGRCPDRSSSESR